MLGNGVFPGHSHSGASAVGHALAKLSAALEHMSLP